MVHGSRGRHRRWKVCLKLRLTLLVGLLLFSGWSVYTRYFDLNAYDLATMRPFRQLSLDQYEATLAGTERRPYQFRVLAFWIVRAAQSVTHLDPLLIDAAIKTVSLTASAALIYAFSATLVSGMGAVLATVLYLLVTAAAFASEGYSIYFTNDYLGILAWFAGALAIRYRAWALAALCAFTGAWAKETPLLIVFLVTFEALRGRAPWWAVGLCAAAFAVPTILIRAVMYPASISDLAWWDNFRRNVPFATLEGGAIVRAFRENLKVILFLNILWWWAWRAWRRARDPYLTSMALTMACYAVLVWMLVYIRELRQMLPFTFFVIPLAVAELETLMQHRLIVIVAFVIGSSSLFAQTQPASSGYLLPPKEIVDILDAPPPPTVEVSPSREVVALLERVSMPTIAELSQPPMLRLAGVR